MTNSDIRMHRLEPYKCSHSNLKQIKYAARRKNEPSQPTFVRVSCDYWRTWIVAICRKIDWPEKL